MNTVLSETLAKPGMPLNRSCEHRPHTPNYDAEACAKLTPEQCRTQYPSFRSTCTVCGQPCRVWASAAHREALDEWEPAPGREDGAID